MTSRLRRALSMPAHLLACRITRAVLGSADQMRRRCRDRWRASYADAASAYVDRPIALPCLVGDKERALIESCQRFLEHRFDLLGSGWVRWSHGSAANGMGGFRYPGLSAVKSDAEGRWLSARLPRACLPEACRVWRLVSTSYEPIDWQMDPKSGWRWSERTWFRDIRYGAQPGADVKLPWEIARMQHLPALAQAYARTGRAIYAREIVDQLLDFIANNPPRWGANWACAMDVAIRAANWTAAWDVVRAAGFASGAEFEEILSRSLLEHGRHIVANLEWSPDLRGNHYLANIAGLAFIATHLSSTPETDGWLAFAIQELIAETRLQFHPDGCNFEASTCYHRLSAEMVCYATAELQGAYVSRRGGFENLSWSGRRGLRPTTPASHRLPGADVPSPFPPAHWAAVERMADVVVALTRDDGCVPQIGDNDNGRFLKWTPSLEEDPLDHRHLAAAASGLVERPDLTAFAGTAACEGLFLRARMGGISAQAQPEKPPAEPMRACDASSFVKTWSTASAEHRCLWRITPVLGLPLNEDLAVTHLAGLGITIFRSRRVGMAIRCGTVGQNGNGGHAHYDQLSIDLRIDGVPWISDPGTGCYTPLPDVREAYRDWSAHFTPLPRSWCIANPDPAMLFRSAHGPGVCAIRDGVFLGEHHAFGWPMRRLVRLTEACIEVLDLGEAPLAVNGTQSIESPLKPALPVSRGYGQGIR